RRRQRIHCLLLEPGSGGPVAPEGYDGFRGPAAGVGNYRGAAGIRLYGYDSEVLLAGKQQGPTPAQVIAERLVRPPAEALDGSTRQRARSGRVLPSATHDQPR